MSKKNNQPWKGAKERRAREERRQRATNNELIEAREVSGKGRGVFALSSFDEGDVVCSFTGVLAEDLQEVDRLFGPALRDYVIFNQKGQVIVPDPSVVGGHLANHSCRPNAGYVGVGDRTVLLTASRPIAAGDEVTVYYAWEGIQNAPCMCGAQHCAGVIGIRHVPTRPGYSKIEQEDGVSAVVVAALNRNPKIMIVMNNLITGHPDEAQEVWKWVWGAIQRLPYDDAKWLVDLCKVSISDEELLVTCGSRGSTGENEVTAKAG